MYIHCLQNVGSVSRYYLELVAEEGNYTAKSRDKVS